MAGHGASNGKVAPAAFPPPVDSPKEFVKRGLDAEDELIEVGVAIVGGGTAGLACANRLLQLLADNPDLMERLGEVPVAVIEKAKTCGGHNLSGAVMRPGPLQELFPDMTREDWRKERFAFGEVTKEAVYMLPNSKAKLRIPTPPNFKNQACPSRVGEGLDRPQCSAVGSDALERAPYSVASRNAAAPDVPGAVCGCRVPVNIELVGHRGGDVTQPSG